MKLLTILAAIWIQLVQSKTILEYILPFDYRAYLKLPGDLSGVSTHDKDDSEDSKIGKSDSGSSSNDMGSGSNDMATLGPDDKPPLLTDPLPIDFTDVPIGILDPPITEPPVKETEPPETSPPTESPVEMSTQSPTKKLTEAPTIPPTASSTKMPTESPVEISTEPPTKLSTKSPTISPTSSSTKTPTKVPTVPPTDASTETATSTSNFDLTSEPVEPTAAVVETPEVLLTGDDIFTTISLEILNNLDLGEASYPALNDDEKEELATQIITQIEEEILSQASETGSDLGRQIFEGVVEYLSDYLNGIAEPFDDDVSNEEIQAANESIAKTVLELVESILLTDVEGPSGLQAYQKASKSDIDMAVQKISKITEQLEAFIEEEGETIESHEIDLSGVADAVENLDKLTDILGEESFAEMITSNYIDTEVAKKDTAITATTDIDVSGIYDIFSNVTVEIDLDLENTRSAPPTIADSLTPSPTLPPIFLQE